jgi:hypothetical protein
MDKIKIIENFISNEDCDFAVSYYNDLLAKNKFNKIADGRLLIPNTTLDFPVDLVLKYIPKINELYNSKFYIRDILLSIYSEGARLDPHIDYEDPALKDSIGLVLYLNDDFEGGKIYFSNFSFTYTPKKGSIIIFPCNDLEYKHGVLPITSGFRYTMPIELTKEKELSIL